MSLRRLVERADRLDTPRVRIAILLLFVGITCVVSYHHEPDRDEADTWLASRDTSLSELLGLTRYVGSPAAGFLLQRPFAKSGLPYSAQAVWHLALGAVSAALLLEHGPFPLVVRACLLAGPYLGFEYSVMRRSYTLSVALLFAALALLAPRRGREPVRGAAVGLLLFVLANTSAYGAALAVAVAAGLLIRDLAGGKPRPLDWGLALLGVGLAAWQLRPPLDGQITGQPMPGTRHLVLAMREAFFPDLPSPAAAAAATALVLLAIVSLAARPGAFFTAVVGFFGPAALITFVYASGRRHYGFLAVGLFAGLWLGAREPETASAVFPRLRRWTRGVVIGLGLLSLGAGVMAGLRKWSLEIDYPTSGAQDMAAFIRAAHLEGRVFVGDRPYVAAGVLPYLPRLRMWYPLFRRFGTYMPWNTLYVRRLTGQAFVERVTRRFPRWNAPGEGVCLLVSRPIARPWRLGFRLAHMAPIRVPLVLTDEILLLYVPVGRVPERTPRVLPILLPWPPGV